jgi:hypothetical protein
MILADWRCDGGHQFKSPPPDEILASEISASKRSLKGELDEADVPDHAMDGVAAAINRVFLGRHLRSRGSKT